MSRLDPSPRLLQALGLATLVLVFGLGLLASTIPGLQKPPMTEWTATIPREDGARGLEVGGAVLEPETDGRSIKSLGTSRPLKVALKRQTVMVAKEDCQCWLWSDPHVETCDGTVADFNPMPEPVHTVAAMPSQNSPKTCRRSE